MNELSPTIVRWVVEESRRLASSRAARRAAADSAHASAIDLAERANRAAVREADAERRTGRTRLDERIAPQVNEARARHVAERASAQRAHKEARATLASETDDIEQRAKVSLREAVWVAETVCEAGEGRPKADYAKALKELERARAEVDVYEQSAAALFQRYKHRPAAAAPAERSPPAGVDPYEATTAAVEDARAALAALSRLKLPRLLDGVMPWIIMFVAAVGAAAAALWRQGWSLDATVAYVGGGAGVVAGLVLLGLRAASRRLVASRARPVSEALSGARRAIDAAAEHARRRRDDALDALRQKRESDVLAAKNKFGPLIERARSDRERGAGEIDAALEESLERIKRERDETIRALEGEWNGAIASIDGRHAERSASIQAELDSARAEADAARENSLASLRDAWRRGVGDVHAAIEAIHERERELFPPWNSPSWVGWSPPETAPPAVRIGTLTFDRSLLAGGVPAEPELAIPGPLRVDLPALVRFPEPCSVLIEHDGVGRDAAVAALRAVMLRILTTFPAGRARFTIFDPVGLGQSFAGFMHLADHVEALVGARIWTEQRHIEQRLADMTEHMETVIQKYLRNEFETIADYNAQAGEIAEPYRFLVIADFATNFSDDAARRLASIASSGARCGVFTLIARDARVPVPAGFQLDDLRRHATSLTLAAPGEGVPPRARLLDEALADLPLSLESPPDDDTLTRLLSTVGEAAKAAARVQVPFEVISPGPAEEWSGDCSQELRVPLGRAGATKLLNFAVGRGTSQHVLIAGKTGSGKSTLLHVLVTNLSQWYSPEQVEFYLVDFKKGVEFKTYATHKVPHARAVAIESDREFGLSVLQRIDEELRRRGELFRSLGVQDLAAARRTDPSLVLPRTLLIVDEFQEFFVDDDRVAQDASLLLDRLVRQGRAFGIHVVLGSQTLAGAYTLGRSTIGQMAVRIALQCSEADAYLIMSEDNSAARLLSRPGEAIYNDASGLVEGNNPFQVSWLSDETRDRALRRVSELARARPAPTPSARPPAIVFEGNVPADISRNEPLAALRSADRRPAALGPPAAYLGEPIAIKDPTAVAFARQTGSNLLIVGQREEPALALIACAAVSLAAHAAAAGASGTPDEPAIVVLDGTPPDDPLAGELDRIAVSLPAAADVASFEGAADALGALAKDVSSRLSDSARRPARFLLVHGLHRFRALRRQEDDFSFSVDEDEKPTTPDKHFASIIRDGPGVGVHTIVWCDTAASVDRFFSRQLVKEFADRVLFQMSPTDSSNLIDSPEAGKLGLHRALLSNEERGVLEKFRPYALPGAGVLAPVP